MSKTNGTQAGNDAPAADNELQFPHTVTLSKKHEFKGETYSSITFREPTGQDYIRCVKIKDATQKRMAALVELADLDIPAEDIGALIRSLNYRDFASCLEVAGFFIETVSMSTISYESLLTSPAILEAVQNNT